MKEETVEGRKMELTMEVVGRTIQLSHDPHTKWSTLSNLELIKERNKPIEAPKQTEQAPFFLPTLPGLVPQFTESKEEEEEEKEEPVNRFIKRGNVMKVENDLQLLLKEARKNETEVM